MGPAYDCLFYWKALFTCQAAAPACVNLRPSSKAHSNRPNVLLLVLKFQYCNIGYWASISRSVFGKNIPRRTQSKLVTRVFQNISVAKASGQEALEKKAILKDSDNVLPESVLAGGRAARLSHDVLMLSGEEI